MIRTAVFSLAAMTAMAAVAVPTAGQPVPLQVSAANPSSLEVRWTTPNDRPVVFDVDLYPSSDAAGTGQPIRTVTRRAGAVVDETTMKVDINDMFDGLPDGEYVATLHIVGTDGSRLRNATSDRFTISGHRSAAVAADRENQRLWTRVGIAIAAGLLLIPFIIR